MTLHRLTAGAGYTYLLKHTASGDCDRSGREPLVAYYTESGNPPGRWLGSGLASLTRAGPDGTPSAEQVVTEQAMVYLFGEGKHPLTGVPLGRPYPKTSPPAERIAAKAAQLPASLTGPARQAAIDTITKVELAKPTPHAVAGFDLTFTPAKSVSTLWALGDRRTQARVHQAHRRAVDQALAFVEQRALFTRTGHAGCRQERTAGMVAVAFDHWDSRAGDPNLHTHVVIANKVQGADGAWRSVDSRALHHAVVAASETYDALLADELSRALPVRWAWRSKGPRRSIGLELDGVDDVLLREFSSRTTQIDEAMTARLADFYATHGRGPNRVEILRLRAQVTRTTRPGKRVRALSELLTSWRERATSRTGMGPAALMARVLRQAHVRPLSAAQVPDAVIEHLAGPVLTQVMERRSTWTRWNVLAEVARTTRGLTMATPEDRFTLLDRVSEAVLNRCVSVEAPAVLTASGRYARADGATVFDRVGEKAHTHPAVLAAEARLLAAAAEDGAPTAALPAAASSSSVRLAEDQVAAVSEIAGSGRRVDVLVGPAGSGKTTTLLALRRAWERTYGRGSVIGLATSSTAAAQLAASLGVTCENTAKWLHESTGAGAATRENLTQRLCQAAATAGADVVRARTIDTAIVSLMREQETWGVQPDQLVIVDEASLASTATLDGVVEQARSAGAKVVLVGDDAQLSSVDAGGAFALLADRARPTRLTSLWRFSHQWEAEATLALRTGDPRVLETYAEQNRVHDGPGEAMLEDAYSAWTADTERGVTSVLIASDTASVTALNHRAHNDRVTDGLVQPDGITTHAGAQIGVGERVVTRTNDRRLRVDGGGWVRNGDLWSVTAIHGDGALTLTRASVLGRTIVSGTVRVPPEYVAEHIEHGYATTTHRAQGITTSTAHVLAHAGMTRENLYVAMTRGREANHVYVAVDAIDPDCDALPDVHAPADARQILSTILTTPGAQTSATATIAAKQDEAESLRRLEPIRRTLLADAAHSGWMAALVDAGMSADAASAVMASPDAGSLIVALGRVAALTSDPVPVLRGLMSDIDSGPDLAQELRSSAARWLGRHTVDPYDIHPLASPEGLDADGIALLGQVDTAIAARVGALTGQALAERPAWLTALGPEPTGTAARRAWLDAVAASAARLDHVSDAASRSTLATAAPGYASPITSGVER
ncbi:MobF family relaxase [Isoptericola sp. b490]|uniref:MobF family relaxase n=1 Tax=Actinotalea lenta TaxID=3064654 RepID=UPI0027132842|nr:MobF family relaxase [Isoptericola sp. b490]MDO8119690.1 MobF family relaxase [Isoptericola sp. b490]